MMMGPTLSFNWPRKLLLELDTILRAIDYVIRESGELGGKDKSLVLHYDPKGCKGYNTEMGTKLMSKGYNIRICSCAFEKKQFNDRKVRRIETQNVNVRDALGAPPPKPCQRFANGICICLLNKKGKKCSSLHNLPGTWEYTPDGKSVCTVECNLKPHATMKGVCASTAKSASTSTPLAPPHQSARYTSPPPLLCTPRKLTPLLTPVSLTPPSASQVRAL
eukprot:scaffold4187_cov118-Isochrysis_galbana.AAC.2